jgi:uncharacterized membrane protein
MELPGTTTMELIKKNRNPFDLLIITAIAFGLRIFMLGSQSLWTDEAAIYSQTRVGSLFEVYSTVMSQEGHIGPLYHILNYLFCQLFGYAEWALRMPSAIYGTISVVLIYKIAELLINRNAALFSSILLACSPLHVWYSQEARMYSLWIMLTLLTTLVFIKLLDKGSPRLWILFTIFASLSLWTFLNSIFLFAAMGLYLVIFVKRYKKELCFFIVCMLAVAASYLPGVITLLARTSGNGTAETAGFRTTSVFDLIYAFCVFNIGTSLGPPLDTIRVLLKQLGPTNAARNIISHYGLLMIPSMLVCTAIFLYAAYKAVIRRKNVHYTLILVLLFVPLLMIYGITFFSSSLRFNVRYILCVLPFYLILLSTAADGLSKVKRWALLSCLILLSAFSLFNHYFKAEYAKLDFRTVVKYLNETMKDGDNAIIIHESASRVLEYYDKTATLAQYDISQHNSFENASSIISRSKRIFYVKSIRTYTYDPEEIKRIENLLAEKFQLVHSDNRALNIEIKIYERPDRDIG